MSVQPHCGKAKLLDHLISRPLTDHPYFPLQVLIVAQSFYWRLSNAFWYLARLTDWLSIILCIQQYSWKFLLKFLTQLKRKYQSIFESSQLIKKEYVAAIIKITAIFRYLIVIKICRPINIWKHAARTMIKIKRVWLTSPRCRLVVSLVKIYQARPYPCFEVRPRWIPNWFLPVYITRRT